MPTAEMHVLTECKHNVMMDQPVRFNRLLSDFCLA
jgi:pimeloyl-ACP methyl ester carboxylesterase